MAPLDLPSEPEGLCYQQAMVCVLSAIPAKINPSVTLARLVRVPKVQLMLDRLPKDPLQIHGMFLASRFTTSECRPSSSDLGAAPPACWTRAGQAQPPAFPCGA